MVGHPGMGSHPQTQDVQPLTVTSRANLAGADPSAGVADGASGEIVRQRRLLRLGATTATWTAIVTA
jgi:hypothetical protein